MKRTLLLDVNVLLSLAWPTHQFHEQAVERLDRKSPKWATCALTQLGFVRLSSNPAAVGLQKTPVEVLTLLAALVQDSRHIFIASLPAPATSMGAFARILGHQQVTDAYLVELARRNRATLLTFDRRLKALDPTGRDVEVIP